MNVTRRLMAGLAAGMFVLAVMAPGASAGRPDPADVARHCIQRQHRIGEAAIHEIARTCRATVAAIEHFLQQGEVERARHAAEEGIERTRRIGAAAAGEIAMTTRECVRILERLGADPELIRAVVRSGDETTQLVHRMVLACADRIREALGG